MTAAQEQNQQLQRRLQQHPACGQDRYINPYRRRFDSNTDRWLREPGQLTEEQIRQTGVASILSWPGISLITMLVIKDGSGDVSQEPGADQHLPSRAHLRPAA